MKGKLVVIGVDAMETSVELCCPPPVEVIHTAVGGPIEVVPFFTTFDGAECVAFCNEEGKLKEMAPNFFAQMLWELAVDHPIDNDFLCGPIVIITGDEELLRSL